jgi:hypothetical protein
MALAPNTAAGDISTTVYAIAQDVQALKFKADEFASFWSGLTDTQKTAYGFDTATLAQISGVAALIPGLSAAISTSPGAGLPSALQICQQVAPFPTL